MNMLDVELLYHTLHSMNMVFVTKTTCELKQNSQQHRGKGNPDSLFYHFIRTMKVCHCKLKERLTIPKPFFFTMGVCQMSDVDHNRTSKNSPQDSTMACESLQNTIKFFFKSHRNARKCTHHTYNMKYTSTLKMNHMKQAKMMRSNTAPDITMEPRIRLLFGRSQGGISINNAQFTYEIKNAPFKAA